MMNVALFNDTGLYPHIGCKAVSNAFEKKFKELQINVLFRHYVGEFLYLQTEDFESSVNTFLSSHLVQEISEVDAVLVNGEGTIHHGAGLQLLIILAGAQVLGKPTYLVNSVLQQIPDVYFSVLRKLNDLTVRDLYSYEYLLAKNVHCRLVPDSILMAEFHEGNDRSFDGKIVVTDCVANRTDVQRQLNLVCAHYGANSVYFPLEGDSAKCWQITLNKLSGAKLVVTGRHHGLYLALMSKRPFVALPSNTWKIEGTLAAVGGLDWLWKSGIDLISMCERAYSSEKNFSPIFDSDFLKNPQSIFDVLISEFSDTRLTAKADTRIEESSDDLEQTAEQIVMSCGVGRTLDIGSGEGVLVAYLLRRGVDAHGLDVSEVVVSRCNQRLSNRFTQGSVLALPFQDGSFQTVVSTNCLEHLAPQDVPKALKEIYRVAGRYVFLKLATTLDCDGQWHLTVEGRAWWEKCCLEAGFIKHPLYYRLNDYEALNCDGWQILILLQKLPSNSVARFPLSTLEAERGLHMDMLRDVGERSDAHVIRYHLASSYIKPGDRVLDAACGLGYGSHVIGHLTSAGQVTGIDGSASSVEYASAMYREFGQRTEFICGMLPEALSRFPAGSFEVVVSFETLEHVENPQALLSEFRRVLVPGGRIIVSVPNDWSDETGRDPNPHHLHVYDWKKLKQELDERFILEDAYAQTASRCKVKAKGNAWEARPRALCSVHISNEAPVDCEWWVMTGMKSPLDHSVPYVERVFANLAGTEHPSIQYAKYYEYPWLMHSMVNAEYRLKNINARGNLATQVMERCPPGSNDHAAALCVLTYSALEEAGGGQQLELLTLIDVALTHQQSDPMSLRWRVSLLFAKGKLLESSGQFDKAMAVYCECADVDVSAFGVHLSTKTTDAAYRAGLIACTVGQMEIAAKNWQSGVNLGARLLRTTLDDILISRGFPNLFNHGDGIREYALAWDNIARCANGLHLLRRGGEIDFTSLNNSFATEYAGVSKDLLQTRKYLSQHGEDISEVRATLIERTERLERVSGELVVRTGELNETRQTLVDRTQMLERATGDLQHRTEELIQPRQMLVDRTEELIQTRQMLVDRTQMLERADGDLQHRTEELIQTRQMLVDRTQELERINHLLREQTEELDTYLSAPMFKRIFIRRMK